MRLINGIISAVILCFFLLHAVLGSASLLSAMPSLAKPLIWVGVGLIVIHIVLSVITSEQMLADKQRPPSVKKRQHLWFKWVSGVLLLLVVCFHILNSLFGFMLVNSDVNLIMTPLLIATLALHICLSVKSLLKDIGLNRNLKTFIRIIVCMICLACVIVITLALL